MKLTKRQTVIAIPFILFGVLLPLITLGVEYTTHMCRKDLDYDPIPTLTHVFIIGLIPFVLAFWGIQRVRLKEVSGPLWRMTLGAIASVSFIFAMPMIPIMPFALIAIIFGVGFLPFAPVSTFFIAAIAVWKTRKSAIEAPPESSLEKFSRIPWGSFGLLIGFGIMSFLSIAEVKTQRAIESAQTGTPLERAESISNLRLLPNAVVKNAVCEYRRVRGPNPLTPISSLTLFDHDIHRDAFRYSPELYWKITGAPCSEKHWSRDARFVTQRDDRPGMTFQESRFDGSIDARAATAYTEWNYTLKNDDTRRREADFIVRLPPGSVVSRVTLWVHGEPREATFAGRAKATAAYEAVVRKAKDPILVSEIGPDKIRVRMFPMLAGKTMKARIGITTPLLLSKNGNELSFPQIVDGNVDHKISHRVWMESKDELKTPIINTSQHEGVFQLRSDLSDEELSKLQIKTPYFANDSYSQKNGRFTKQSLKMEDPTPTNITLLVDGSVRMKKAAKEIGDAFETLELEGTISLVFVGDASTLETKIEGQNWTRETKDKLKTELINFDYVGGRDNRFALEQIQKNSKPENDIVVWIHAAQPVTFGSHLDLLKIKTPIYVLQVDGQRDVNLEALYLAAKVIGIPRHDSLSKDLHRFLHSLSSPTLKRKLTYGINDVSNYNFETMHKTSDHLFRLGAREEVDRLLISGKQDQAIKLAHENQIVTRVSAAVVLETKEQYKQNGLDQANGQGVPTVPEPEEWALIIIGTLCLFFVIWRKRREEEFGQMGLG